MQRREFHQRAVSAAVLTLLGLAGCGGGGGGGPGVEAAQDVPLGAGPADPLPGTEDQPPARLVARIGSNLSGMERAEGLRTDPNVLPNVNFAVPRAAEVRWLAVNGFGKNRLPFSWELLQPMLSTTPASAQARSIIGEPGSLHEGYAAYIESVLDAHAAAGARCILDCHNYCRYRDFRFQPDGSVIGLARPADPLAHAYTTDASQVFTRIMATAPGATITPPAFADFWRRVALRWKDHPGFGGYGLMNEPHELPAPGSIVETPEDSNAEDRRIWPVFARAAIDAVRAVDPSGTIYLAGNAWGGAMTLNAEFNPEWPLPGGGIVYEVHSYVDAWNSGNGADWDIEVAKGNSAGFGNTPLTLDTGLRRMEIATRWAREHGRPIALTETGMPIDDPRWQEAFRRMIEHTWANGWEIQSWAGGSHPSARHHSINHVPGWHQNRTLEPLVAGPMKAVAGIDRAALFDDLAQAPSNGGPVTVTVYARGHLAAPVTLTLSSSHGGRFSKGTLVIPAGANTEDSYTFMPAPDTVTTITYQAATGRQVPPPRRVQALADPVAHAATNLADAARAILARYGAALWDLADGHTDHLLGRPAQDGERVRAIADSGYASRPGNAFDMLNWMNQDTAGMGPLQPPVMRRDGHPHSDHSPEGSTGFWCRKRLPSDIFPGLRNRAPYGVHEPHFALAAIGLPAAGLSGTVFLATVEGLPRGVELALANGGAQARWADGGGGTATLAGPAPAVGSRAVLALTGAQGRQQLRVNGTLAAGSSASFGQAPLGDLMIGWGGPRRDTTFRGHVHAVITGPGNPSDAELAVLERYLASIAG